MATIKVFSLFLLVLCVSQLPTNEIIVVGVVLTLSYRDFVLTMKCKDPMRINVTNHSPRASDVVMVVVVAVIVHSGKME
ncbi:hypothetical protein AgCh_034359 [Apium graveolens]